MRDAVKRLHHAAALSDPQVTDMWLTNCQLIIYIYIKKIQALITYLIERQKSCTYADRKRIQNDSGPISTQGRRRRIDIKPMPILGPTLLSGINTTATNYWALFLAQWRHVVMCSSDISFSFHVT